MRLLSLVHQELWDEHARYYNKVPGARINQGNFGQVWRACHIDPDGLHTVVVVKETTHTPESALQDAHELECLRRLNEHLFRGHAINLFSAFLNVRSHEVANLSAMESGITTLFHIQLSHSRLGTGTAQAWMRPLARVVWAFHEVQVTYRDLKPPNCMVRSGQEASLDLKLVDFGNSAVVSAGTPVPGASHHLTWATTPNYRAPEWFSDFRTLSGDVWSSGVGHVLTCCALSQDNCL